MLDAEEVPASVLPGHMRERGSSLDPASGLSTQAAGTLARLEEGPVNMDAPSRELAIPPERLAPILLELELEGHRVRTGARVARTC